MLFPHVCDLVRLNTFAQPFKRIVYASFTFRAWENESPKLHPTIRDKRNFRKADKRSEMIAARNPCFVLVHDRIFSRLCKRESVLVPTTLLSGSKFVSLSSCVVNYNTTLSPDHSACFRLYNERRASVLFGHQDGKQKTFSRASLRSLSAIVKQLNKSFQTNTIILIFRGKTLFFSFLSF